MKYKSIMLFSFSTRKWKSGMGYRVINIHNIEPKIYFCGWFIWIYFVTFCVSDMRMEGVWNISDKDWQGDLKIVDFLVISFLNDPYDIPANKTLLLGTGKHCFAKKELKTFAFSWISVSNLLLINNGDMTGTFLTLKKVFTIDQ